MTTKPLYELYNGSQLLFETPNDGYSYFFGYYDKSPLNRDNTMLLAHRVAFDGRDVEEGDEADVGYFDLDSGKYNVIGKTRAFNWQQGSHLQWLPPAFDRVVLYNDCRDGKFVCIRYEIDTQQEKVLPLSIYAVHPSGSYALCVNYERLYYCRPGYRYFGVVNPKWDTPYQEDDGIFKVDLETGEVSQLISTADIVHKSPLSVMQREYNWLEHMMWNPSGTRFAFFHRWDNGRGAQPTRLYTADSAGGEIHTFPDTLFYSHMGWKNDHEFTIWAEPPSVKGQALKKVRDYGVIYDLLRGIYQPFKAVMPKKGNKKILSLSAYLTYVDKEKSFDPSILPLEELPVNGHNTWTKDEKLMLTDSYQDDESYRWLWLYDANERKRKNLGKFYSMYNDCGYRVDLHPRISVDEQLIVIDAGYFKQRKILLLRRG